jgi:hypothetical protein
MQKNHKKNSKKYWSDKITKHSNALDLEPNVFAFKNSRKIALSLKFSAEESKRRKAKPFQSAMSMLNFYINRAGKNLDKNQKIILEQAKIELRKIFNKKVI